MHRGASLNLRTGPGETTLGESSQKRLEWVDYAKGICIIFVVYGHTVGGLQAAGIVATSGLHAYFNDALEALRMPTMFFL